MSSERLERLDEFAQMEHGWLDGRGRAPTNCALAIARSIVAHGLEASIYPTPAGGVMFEADANGISWAIEIGPRGRISGFWIDIPPGVGLVSDPNHKNEAP